MPRAVKHFSILEVSPSREPAAEAVEGWRLHPPQGIVQKWCARALGRESSCCLDSAHSTRLGRGDQGEGRKADCSCCSGSPDIGRAGSRSGLTWVPALSRSERGGCLSKRSSPQGGNLEMEWNHACEEVGLIDSRRGCEHPSLQDSSRPRGQAECNTCSNALEAPVSWGRREQSAHEKEARSRPRSFVCAQTTQPHSQTVGLELVFQQPSTDNATRDYFWRLCSFSCLSFSWLCQARGSRMSDDTARCTPRGVQPCVTLRPVHSHTCGRWHSLCWTPGSSCRWARGQGAASSAQGHVKQAQ